MQPSFKGGQPEFLCLVVHLTIFFSKLLLILDIMLWKEICMHFNLVMRFCMFFAWKTDRISSRWVMWSHEKFPQCYQLTIQDPCQLSTTCPIENCESPSGWWVFKLVRQTGRFAPSQWKTAFLCNDVSHWLGAIHFKFRISVWKPEDDIWHPVHRHLMSLYLKSQIILEI